MANTEYEQECAQYEQAFEALCEAHQANPDTIPDALAPCLEAGRVLYGMQEHEDTDINYPGS